MSIRIPARAQRAELERACSATRRSDYGCWWNAPPLYTEFAYYMMLRRCYRMPAHEAIAYLRRFPGRTSEWVDGLRATTRLIDGRIA